MQFTSTFPSHGKTRTDERDTETQDFKRQESIHEGRQVQEKKCCCEGIGRREESAQPEQDQREHGRDTRAEQAAGLSQPQGAGRSYCHRCV